METTELGFTKKELLEVALTLELVQDGEELTLEELQDMLSEYAGDVL